MATVKQIAIKSEVLTEVNTAKAKMGPLPLNARRNQVVTIDETKLPTYSAGIIKGLIYAGGGSIYSSYTCLMDASDRDAQRITYTKNGKEEQLAVPSWEPTAGAEVIELVAL